MSPVGNNNFSLCILTKLFSFRFTRKHFGKLKNLNLCEIKAKFREMKQILQKINHQIGSKKVFHLVLVEHSKNAKKNTLPVRYLLQNAACSTFDRHLLYTSLQYFSLTYPPSSFIQIPHLQFLTSYPYPLIPNLYPFIPHLLTFILDPSFFIHYPSPLIPHPYL